jgi:hypothetical protein
MQQHERRAEPRAKGLSDHRAEFKFPGVPVYQFKARDISEIGAGIVVRADSGFLNMIEVGQELNVNLLVPRGSNPSGYFKSRVKHISELENSRFKGHLAVGLSIHDKVPFYGY